MAAVYALTAQGRTDDALDALFELADEVACYDQDDFAKMLGAVDLERLNTSLLVGLLVVARWCSDATARQAIVTRVRARLTAIDPARVDALMRGLE